MLTAAQRLKIELMTHGIAVSDAAREELSAKNQRPLTLADYATTSGISMELTGRIWVNAPIQHHNPNFVRNPPYLLDYESGSYLVRTHDLEIGAEPVPVPAYHDQVNRWGEQYTSYAITHTDRVRISPIEGCSIVCKFCDLPYKYRYRKKRIEGLVDAVQRALDDEHLPAQHVLISGGTPRLADYEYENEIYEVVLRAFPHLDVDIMMTPTPGLLNIDHLYRLGVHGLSINLELFSKDYARKIMPLKARQPREEVLRFIERAVAVFGPGKVRSLLLLGLEPLEDSLRGVEALAERGCEPTLSPFRPEISTPLRSKAPPSVEFLVEAYERSHNIAARHGIKLGPQCTPCHHNTLTFPDDSGWYYTSHRRERKE